MRRFVVVVLLILAACTHEVPIEKGPPIDVHFCEREDCVSLLVQMLQEAHDAKCALYQVSLPAVKAALKNAEVITDDNKGPLMHNKFCIFNSDTVWTGSWNPTKGNKANNVVIVHSKALAKNYLDEFDELPGGFWHVKYPQISYNNHILENYFCPEDHCKDHVMEQLSNAKHSIVFIISWITDKDIIKTLNEKHQEMDVKGVIEKSEKDALKALPFATPGSIHHKVFIIDGETVITGSYNPTKNGDEYNDENILIIHDRDIAKKFVDEYTYLIS